MKALIIIMVLAISVGYSQNSASVNGCGPTSSSLISSIAPDGPFPLSTTIFEPACNIHDVCYGYGGKPQNTCDTEFLDTLLDICEIYSGFEKDYCNWFAHNMYWAVDQFGENAVDVNLLVDEELKTVSDVAIILPENITIEIYNAGIFGDEFKICGKVKNIARFNSHFKLYLFAANKRELPELPDVDFQLAWLPLLNKNYFELKTGQEKSFCLDTGGVLGVARNLSHLYGEYRLELWVNSSRDDIGFKLADFIEGKIAK